MNAPLLHKIFATKALAWAWGLIGILIVAIIYQLNDLRQVLYLGLPEITQVKPVKPVVQLPSITRYHVFGEAQVASAELVQVNLAVLGIFADPSGITGSAIISKDNGAGKTYRVGQTIAPGIKVQKIFPDKVVISRGGKTEELKIPRPDFSAGKYNFPELPKNEE